MQVEHFHGSTMDLGHCSEEREALLSNNKHEGAGSIIKSSRAVIHELGTYTMEIAFSIYRALNLWCLVWGPWMGYKNFDKTLKSQYMQNNFTFNF